MRLCLLVGGLGIIWAFVAHSFEMPFDAAVVADTAVFWTLFFCVAQFPTALAFRLVHLDFAAAGVCSMSRPAARLAHDAI